MNQEPIFIIGLHKSGTSLLRNLLDGHPDLFVIPFETHFFQYNGFWVDNEYRRSRPKPSQSIDDISDHFTSWIQKMNRTNNQFADSFVKGMLDVSAFKKAFRPFTSAKSHKQRLTIYFKAIAAALGETKFDNNTHIVEKSIENSEFTLELNKMYPKARFIRIIRNPYSNIVSLRKFQTRNYKYPLLHRLLSTMETSYRHLYKNRYMLDNYHIIRYEDLVINPESILKEMCTFLNIPFKSSLLQPTICGKPWKGNSTSKNKFDGISSSRLQSWKNEITPAEHYYVNKLFDFIFEDFDYKIEEYSGPFLKKHKDENIQRYLVNRLHRIYYYHLDD